MDHQTTARQIVEAVGGERNINSVYHCITRLRFDLKDNNLANREAIGNMDSVMGTNIAGDQFQIIIGNQVAQVYDALVQTHPALKNGDSQTTKTPTEPGKTQNPFSRLFEFIAGVFAPMLPAIAGAGLLKGLIALLVWLGVMTAGTDVYRILSAIGDGVFHYLPMLIAFSAARKFGCNPFVAVGVSMALMYPDMTALLSSGNPVSFIGLPVTSVVYASSVIPILLAIWIQSYVEKGIDRIIPASLKLLLVPLLTLLIVVPLTLIVIGPLGTIVGNGLSGGINWLLAEGGVFAGIILGGAMPLIVMTGMHYALVPVILSNLATIGADKFLPLTYISNMGQAGATLGVFFRARDKKLKSIALSTSFTALMGVTEPAMYGVNMRFKKPFVAGMIGSAVGGGFALAFGTNAYVLAGNGGIPGLPALIGPTFLYGVSGMAIAFVVATIVSVVMGISENVGDADQIAAASTNGANPATMANTQATTSQQTQTIDAAATNPSATVISEPQPPTAGEVVQAPLQGRSIPLSEVNDPTFGDELMGKGIAFVPTVGTLVSPVSGVVVNLFKTKHAIVIRSEQGAELLIHIGINTVKLRGQHFEALVATGDSVQAGQPLLHFDLEQIAAEYDITTAMVVTNTAEYTAILPLKLGDIQTGDPVLQLELPRTDN
ncbi:beta-glucoside-specific PTS transporter subunit IIABC [Paenibacillus sp. WLX1005]|uniref:beta-glucoside-specific PTS transporter subunit IIABC n=1 Tax=Paenibacillus sp. WLX1005 TaxID=3243766 RepID=UPI003983EF7C